MTSYESSRLDNWAPRFGWVHAMYRRNGLYFDSINFIALFCQANCELLMNNEDSDGAA